MSDNLHYHSIRLLAQAQLQDLQREYWSDALEPADAMTCFRSADFMLGLARTIAEGPSASPQEISLVANAGATVALMTGSLPSVSDPRVRKMVCRILRDNPRFEGKLDDSDFPL